MLRVVHHCGARSKRVADEHDGRQVARSCKSFDVRRIVFGAIAARWLPRIAVPALIWSQHTELRREALRDRLPDATVMPRRVQAHQCGTTAWPFPVVQVEAVDVDR